jgi:general secretion pathway protein G
VGLGQSGDAQIMMNPVNLKGILFSCAASSKAKKKLSGFTLIELIVVIAVLSVLISIFLNRVEYYQELAEKTAMTENVGAIQSALTLQHSKHYIRVNTEDISLLPTENPMKWLQKLPQNYAGEFYDPKPNTVAPGNWVFDLKAHELIYILDRTDHFVPGRDGKKWIRFHIAMQYEQIKSGGVVGKEKELVGTVFAPTDQISWF